MLRALPSAVLHGTACAPRRSSRARAARVCAMASGIGVPLPGATHATCAYIDYNATTPIFPEVAAQMAPFLFEHFGNPSSGHAFSRPVRVLGVCDGGERCSHTS